MEGYVKLSNLALIIITAVAAVSGVYFIILLRNLNRSVKVIRDILQTNKVNIDETLKNMPLISKNTAEITETAKEELKAVGTAIESFRETAELTAAAAETLKSDILRKIRSFIDIIDFLVGLFNRKKKNEKNERN
jgi:DNA-binding transcriptional MerR regulator